MIGPDSYEADGPISRDLRNGRRGHRRGWDSRPPTRHGRHLGGRTYRLMYASALLFAAATLYRRRTELRDVWGAMVADARTARGTEPGAPRPPAGPGGQTGPRPSGPGR